MELFLIVDVPTRTNLIPEAPARPLPTACCFHVRLGCIPLYACAYMRQGITCAVHPCIRASVRSA